MGLEPTQISFLFAINMVMLIDQQRFSWPNGNILFWSVVLKLIMFASHGYAMTLKP